MQKVPALPSLGHITYLPPCLEQIPVLPGFVFATSASSQMHVKQQKKERFERNRTWRSHVDVTYTLKRSRPFGRTCTATAPLPVHRACGICYLCVRMCTGVAKIRPGLQRVQCESLVLNSGLNSPRVEMKVGSQKTSVNRGWVERRIEKSNFNPGREWSLPQVEIYPG